MNVACGSQQWLNYCSTIIPVNAGVYNQISKDDGIRPGTTMAALTKLKPAFKEDGSTTAGQFNCCQC